MLDEYRSFGELEAACRAFCDEVNTRPHRETRRPPAEALAEERQRLHPVVKAPFTVAFGTTRRVNWNGTVSVEGVRYSVPHQLVDTRVWVRFQGDDLIVTTVGETGPAEVARHARSTPGTPSIKDELATYSDWKGLSRPARWPIRSVLESSARSAVTEGLEAVPANTTTVKPETRLLLMLDFAGGVVNAQLTAMTAGPGEYLTAWEVAGAGAELGIWAGR